MWRLRKSQAGSATHKAVLWNWWARYSLLLVRFFLLLLCLCLLIECAFTLLKATQVSWLISIFSHYYTLDLDWGLSEEACLTQCSHFLLFRDQGTCPPWFPVQKCEPEVISSECSIASSSIASELSKFQLESQVQSLWSTVLCSVGCSRGKVRYKV